MPCTEPTLIYQASPVVVLTSRTVFEVSYDGTTVTLPTPEHNNRVESKLDRIQRKLPGGKLITVAPTGWGLERTYKYTFAALTVKQRDDFIAFLVASIGQPVTVVDHNGLTYTGIIRNPGGDIGDNLRECGYSCALEIEKL